MSKAHRSRQKQQKEVAQDYVAEHEEQLARTRAYVASLSPEQRKKLLDTLYQQNLQALQQHA